MSSFVSRRWSLVVAVLLSFSLTGCGTILYPERKGQVGGRIDPAVAIMDGFGLLLFFVPGVVAFAVDFSNGTIYLPGGKHARLTANELNGLRTGKMNAAELASRITHHRVQRENVIVQRAADLKQVAQFLSAHADTTVVQKQGDA